MYVCILFPAKCYQQCFCFFFFVNFCLSFHFTHTLRKITSKFKLHFVTVSNNWRWLSSWYIYIYSKITDCHSFILFIHLRNYFLFFFHSLNTCIMFELITCSSTFYIVVVAVVILYPTVYTLLFLSLKYCINFYLV